MTTTTVNYSQQELEAMSYGMLQTQAKNAGLKWVGVKKVALIEGLLKEYASATTDSSDKQTEPETATEYEFLFTTAPDGEGDVWSETVEILPIMNAKNKQWRKVKVESGLAGEQKSTYLQDNHSAYSATEFEQIRSFQLPFQENAKLDSRSTAKKSPINKEVYISPLSELKPAKSGTKVAIEIAVLRNGATAEEVCEALSWKCWSHSRSSVLKLGYGLRRDGDKKFWLVEPETAMVR